MIAFVGSQTAQTEWVVPQDHDAEVAHVMTGEGMTESQAKKYVRTLGHPDTTLDSVMWTSVDKNADGWLQRSELPELLNELQMAAISSISQRVDIAPLWVYAMIIEHVVFLIRVVLLTQFPVVPSWIGHAREVVRLRIDEMKQEVEYRGAAVAGGQFTEDMLAAPTKGILHVTVIEAEGLPTMDANSTISMHAPHVCTRLSWCLTNLVHSLRCERQLRPHQNSGREGCEGRGAHQADKDVGKQWCCTKVEGWQRGGSHL